MKSKLGSNDIRWTAAGAAVLLAGMLVVLHFYKEQNPSAQLAFKARRVDLVERMQRDLAAASEAEKSAVLAITDQDSQTLADQAHAASANVEVERRELEELLTAGGTPDERELLAQFATASVELQTIDNDLLALAVKNTNLKAYGLAFGPAAAAVSEMNAALARLVAAQADAPAAKPVMHLAYDAQLGALRLQTLLPPHIAEENDRKMDALEVQMATEDALVRHSLAGLTTIPALSHDPELAIATARYAEFCTLKTNILALSRENTNVRSLSLSLNQKRKVMLVCQGLLGALQQAILAEPIAGVTYGTPVRPRQL